MQGLSWNPPVYGFLQSLACGTREAASAIARKKLPILTIHAPETSDQDLLVSIHPKAADVARVEVWSYPCGSAPLLMLWIQHCRASVPISGEVVVHIAQTLLDGAPDGLFTNAGTFSLLAPPICGRRLKCLYAALRALVQHVAFQNSTDFIVATDGSLRDASAGGLRSFRISRSLKLKSGSETETRNWLAPSVVPQGKSDEAEREVVSSTCIATLGLDPKSSLLKALHERQSAMLAGKLRRSAETSPQPSTQQASPLDAPDYARLLNSALSRRVRALEESVIRLLNGGRLATEVDSGKTEETLVALHRRKLMETRKAASKQPPETRAHLQEETEESRVSSLPQRQTGRAVSTKPKFEDPATLTKKRAGEKSTRSVGGNAKGETSKALDLSSSRQSRRVSEADERSSSSSSQIKSQEWFAGIHLENRSHSWGSDSALRGTSQASSSSSSVSSSEFSTAAKKSSKTQSHSDRKHRRSKRETSRDAEGDNSASKESPSESPEEAAHKAFLEARDNWIRRQLQIEEANTPPLFLPADRWLRLHVALGDPSPSMRRYIKRMQNKQKRAERLSDGSLAPGKLRRATACLAFDAMFNSWKKANSVPVRERNASRLLEALFAEVGMRRQSEAPHRSSKLESEMNATKPFSPDTWLKSLGENEKKRIFAILESDLQNLAPPGLSSSLPASAARHFKKGISPDVSSVLPSQLEADCAVVEEAELADAPASVFAEVEAASVGEAEAEQEDEVPSNDVEETKPGVARIRVETLHESNPPDQHLLLPDFKNADSFSKENDSPSSTRTTDRHVHFENQSKEASKDQRMLPSSESPSAKSPETCLAPSSPPRSKNASSARRSKAKAGVLEKSNSDNVDPKARMRNAFFRLREKILPLNNNRRKSNELLQDESAAGPFQRVLPETGVGCRIASSPSAPRSPANARPLSQKRLPSEEGFKAVASAPKSEKPLATPVPSETCPSSETQQTPKNAESAAMVKVALSPPFPPSDVSKCGSLRPTGPRAAGVARNLNVDGGGLLQLNPDLFKKAENERRRRAQAMSEMAVLHELMGKPVPCKVQKHPMPPPSPTPAQTEDLSVEQIEAVIRRQTDRKKVEDDLRRELAEATSLVQKAASQASAALREKEALERTSKAEAEERNQELDELKKQLKHEQERASLLEKRVSELKEKSKTLLCVDGEKSLSVSQLLQVKTPLLKLPRHQRVQFLKSLNQALVNKAKEERRSLEASKSLLVSLKSSVETLQTLKFKASPDAGDDSSMKGFAQASRALDESVEAVLRTSVATAAQALRAISKSADLNSKETLPSARRGAQLHPTLLPPPPSASSLSLSSSSEEAGNGAKNALFALEELPDMRLLREIGDNESIAALKSLKAFNAKEIKAPQFLAEEASLKVQRTKREWERLVESLNEETARQAASLEDCSTAEVSARSNPIGPSSSRALHSSAFFSQACQSPDTLKKHLLSAEKNARLDGFALLRSSVVKRLVEMQRRLSKEMALSHGDPEETERLRQEMRAFAKKRAKCELLLKRLLEFCQRDDEEEEEKEEETEKEEIRETAAKGFVVEAKAVPDQVAPSPLQGDSNSTHARRVLEEAIFGRSPSQAECDHLGNVVVAKMELEQKEEEGETRRNSHGAGREERLRDEKRAKEENHRSTRRNSPPRRGSSRDEIDSLVEAAARGRLPSNLVRDILSFEGRAAPGQGHVSWRPNEALDKLAGAAFGKRVAPDVSELQPPSLTFRGHRTTGVWFQFADKERQDEGVFVQYQRSDVSGVVASKARRRTSSGRRREQSVDRCKECHGNRVGLEDRRRSCPPERHRDTEGGNDYRKSKEVNWRDAGEASRFESRRTRSASTKRGLSQKRQSKRIIPIVDPLDFKPPPRRKKLLDTSWAKFGRPAPLTKRERQNRLPSEEQPENLDFVDNALDAIYKVVVGPPPEPTASETTELTPKDERASADAPLSYSASTFQKPQKPQKPSLSHAAANDPYRGAAPQPLSVRQSNSRRSASPPHFHFPKAVAAQCVEGEAAFAYDGRPKVPLRKKAKNPNAPKKRNWPQSTASSAALKLKASTRLDLSRVHTPHENDDVPRLSEEELRELKASPDGDSDSDCNEETNLKAPTNLPARHSHGAPSAKEVPNRLSLEGNSFGQGEVPGSSLPPLRNALPESDAAEAKGGRAEEAEVQKSSLLSEQRAELLSKLPLKPHFQPPAYNKVPLPPTLAPSCPPCASDVSAVFQVSQHQGPSESAKRDPQTQSPDVDLRRTKENQTLNKIPDSAPRQHSVGEPLNAMSLQSSFPRGAFENLWSMWKYQNFLERQPEGAVQTKMAGNFPVSSDARDGCASEKTDLKLFAKPGAAVEQTTEGSTLQEAPSVPCPGLEYSEIMKERAMLRGMDSALAAPVLPGNKPGRDAFAAIVESNEAFNKLWDLMNSSESPS